MNLKVSLPSELVEFARTRVASGAFASVDDVISHALMMLEGQKQQDGAEVVRLREAWIEGVESGDFAPLDTAALKREGRKLLNASQN